MRVTKTIPQFMRRSVNCREPLLPEGTVPVPGKEWFPDAVPLINTDRERVFFRRFPEFKNY